MTDRSLFNIVPSEDEHDLILPGSEVKTQKPCVESVLEIPKPGFCVKTRSEDGNKTFINICTSDKVPEPPDITENELQQYLEAGDVGKFRVPMSVGPPHGESDKSGGACTAYDVVINPRFCAKVRREGAFQQFLLAAILTIIEQKHDVKLRPDSCVLLRNKRSIGRLEPQLMRLSKKPFVVELDQFQSSSSSGAAKPEASYATLPCKHSVTVEPAQGKPEFVVVEIKSPHVKSAKWLELDVGEDRIELVVRRGGYRLDLDLPYWVHPEQGGAQFHCQKNVLTLTLPVQEGGG